MSRGCERCYAERFAARGLPGMLSPTTGEPFARMTRDGPRWTGAVELIPSKLAEPLSWQKPARVFVNSMSDLFHEGLDDHDIDRVFAVMAHCSQPWYRCATRDCDHDHCPESGLREIPAQTFQILTKRPERALAYLSATGRHEKIIEAWSSIGWHFEHPPIEESEWPLPNVWLGTSVEDQATADARIPVLLRCPAAVRLVSYEPALGPVDFGRSLGEERLENCGGCKSTPVRGAPYCPGEHQGGGIDWLICGGESGPGARPFEIAWARSAVEQCRAAGVPIFLKQFGANPIARTREDMTAEQFVAYDANAWDELAGPVTLRLRDRKGGDIAEWPDDLTIRQFPEAAHA